MQEGRAKAARLITIFVVCSFLIVLALVWIFTDGTLYRNRILESFMALLVVILLCTVVEVFWKPFTSEPTESSNFPIRRDSDAFSINMDLPLVYSESPPAYEDVVGAPFQETGFSEVSGPRIDRSLGAVSISTEPNGSSSIKSSNDVPTFETSSNSEAGRNAVATDDDFEEIYIPRRYSPFFSEEGPVPNAYTTSRELQLSVNCLPTYEEALNALQPESWNPSGSDTGTQDNNLIIFM